MFIEEYFPAWLSWMSASRSKKTTIALCDHCISVHEVSWNLKHSSQCYKKILSVSPFFPHCSWLWLLYCTTLLKLNSLFTPVLKWSACNSLSQASTSIPILCFDLCSHIFDKVKSKLEIFLLVLWNCKFQQNHLEVITIPTRPIGNSTSLLACPAWSRPCVQHWSISGLSAAAWFTQETWRLLRVDDHQVQSVGCPVCLHIVMWQFGKQPVEATGGHIEWNLRLRLLTKYIF